MEFVVRHVALTQSRINLGCHDADADGWLTEEARGGGCYIGGYIWVVT